ncbi:MAG: glucose-1-phosphate adenylyltransferase [Candidatus Thiodiazotropha sp.]
MAYQNPRFVSRLTRNALALVLAGGRGSRLKHLTKWRAKPAVPFGGAFRIIDFALSNCLNSGIRRMCVLTQYKADSLIQHIQQGWNFLEPDLGEFVQLLPAQQRIESNWYSGTADAVYQNLDLLRLHNPDYVLILAGDQIYKMDYGSMLAHHVENDADLTIAVLETPVEEAKRLSVVTMDESNAITKFIAKPEDPKPLPGSTDKCLTSMGIYVFNRKFLFERLINDADYPESSHDFTFDIIPSLLDKYRVYGYPFKKTFEDDFGYWRDVGTVDAYWQANLELLGAKPTVNLHEPDWPIFTYRKLLPPVKFVFDDDERRGTAVNSMITGGCLISGSQIRSSLLFSNVRVNSYSSIQNSVVLPDVVIGTNCRIRNSIIDRGCKIPDGLVIGEDFEVDSSRFYITEKGITLVTPEMLGQDINFVR